MRYHFFLHYGWFFQNLGKEGRRTFMHTTVFEVLFYSYWIENCSGALASYVEHKQKQRLSKLKLSETLFALSQASANVKLW